ncbi:MAG: phosphate ABC transporter ATP-binding protein [Thermoplasmata archaeon]|nr:phosphate ABC transporter ATP-binding protein [Thermoplasmata archaeon]MCK5415507.1 phosphate ABC transporter ATP-binding protein [Thermoplasmata archaeon]
MSHHGEGLYKLEVRDLTLELERKRILDGVVLGIQEGESFCILGGSGAGKSMLLRTIVRLHEPSSGEILLDGRTICDLEPSVLRRRVNLVPQSPAMLDGTVGDNLMFGLDLAGVPPEEAKARASDALTVAALDPSFLDRRADKLSGGERQRVAIARAHALRPEVLLLDEPTAALDPRRTREVERAILDLKKATTLTMVIVTHDIEQARRLGDRTVLLRRGRVVAEGDSSTLLEDLDPDERARYMGELDQWHDDVKEGDACE